MGLHHFLWNGRERSVAVFKSADKLTLTFLDEELVSKGLQKLSITAGQTLSQLLQKHNTEAQQQIREILIAVQQTAGLQLFFQPFEKKQTQ
jgi:hypothetical protein